MDVDAKSEGFTDGARSSGSSLELWTPLHSAAIVGSEGTAVLLLKAGANFEARDPTGKTALHLAAREGREGIIEILARAGANIEAKLDGSTPFDFALRRGRTGALKALLQTFLSAPKSSALHERFKAHLEIGMQRRVLDMQVDVQNDQALRVCVEHVRLFINALVASVAEQQGALEEVYAQGRAVHKPMFDQAMAEIKQENPFRLFNNATATIQAVLVSDGKLPQQQSNDVLALYAKARTVNAKFDTFVAALAQASGGQFLEAPVKSLFRALEKTGLRTEEERWDASGLCDVVRGTVQFDHVRTMGMFFSLLCSATDARSEVNKQGAWFMDAAAVGVDTKIVLVRVQNRFVKPTRGGWSDCVVNFHFADDQDKHVCEVVLVHARLMAVKKDLGADERFVQSRLARELLVASGQAAVVERLDREGEGEGEGGDLEELAPSPSQPQQAVGDVPSGLASSKK